MTAKKSKSKSCPWCGDSIPTASAACALCGATIVPQNPELDLPGLTRIPDELVAEAALLDARIAARHQPRLATLLFGRA